MTERELNHILKESENYDLEFKKAEASFSKKKLNDYCAAIANENGGWLILGVDDGREIVGTNAFLDNWNKLARQLTDELKIRIIVYQVVTSRGRVLIFKIPRHYIASPVQSKGGKYRYPIRDGESIVEMDQHVLEDIFAERDQDWSSIVAEGATIKDLDSTALDTYRSAWSNHMKKPDYLRMSYSDMLQNLRLVTTKGVTNAALLLFGHEDSLAQFMPDAEIIFEWRNKDFDISYGDRRNWRAGFMIIKDEIWNAINARNSIVRYGEGFTQRELSAFDEVAVREAVVNAFVHRDYRVVGRSIMIKASPEKLYIENPGRLMPGVTLDNIFDKSVWRNRLLAEALEKINIMERSSQGIDTIFRTTIEAGKGLPILNISEDPAVQLTVPAILQDQQFIKYLESVSKEKQVALTVKEVIELEQIRRGEKKKELAFKNKFITLGIIEKVGQGRGSRYILSHRYYSDADSLGAHTRLKGLTREVKREIIMGHLRKNGRVTNSELQEAMLEMQMVEISTLLKGMAKDGLIEHKGPRRYGYWVIKGVDL
jgi:ATP-dependent DNA helicase RecG